jgi:hypothetical protein
MPEEREGSLSSSGPSKPSGMSKQDSKEVGSRSVGEATNLSAGDCVGSPVRQSRWEVSHYNF